jgi:hypothetical protein
VQADLKAITRRHFFRDAGFGIGTLALTSLLNRELFAHARRPHFAPRAKNVIFLFMSGGPSHVDLFDPKPKLNELHGRKAPDEIMKNRRFSFIKGVPNMLGSPYAFRRHGRSGAAVSDLLPWTSRIVDDLAIVRSVRHEHFAHSPAQIFMSSGHGITGRPSVGSWLTYGLGSANGDLPGFVVMVSGQLENASGTVTWNCGFMPTAYQGVEMSATRDPVLCLSNPAGVGADVRRRTIEAIGELNRTRLKDAGDPEIQGRIDAYELAFRMQASVPELMDLSKESEEVHRAYGTEPGKVSFGNNCLLARRLVERGVRFVQLYHQGWDHHGTSAANDIVHTLPRLCRETDQPAAALVGDLKRRGLLDSTLVIWGGEFGRTPMQENRGDPKFIGRDHHPHGFTMWFAGGGIKPGITIGETDELGFSAVKDVARVHDLHATVLHLMGLDHTKLTYRFEGRDYRLTDVRGNVIPALLA